MDLRAGVTFPALLAAARRGDGAALDDLVRGVERSLLGFCRARGADDPEGLANEVLVRVCRGVGGFDGGEAQFRAWVFTIARNHLVDERRRTARRPALVATAPALLPERPAVDEVGVGGDERAEALLAALTEDQREVVLLRVVVGLTVEETAAVVGRRPGAVRALQHRALRQLRKNITGGP